MENCISFGLRSKHSHFLPTCSASLASVSSSAKWRSWELFPLKGYSCEYVRWLTAQLKPSSFHLASQGCVAFCHLLRGSTHHSYKGAVQGNLDQVPEHQVEYSKCSENIRNNIDNVSQPWNVTLQGDCPVIIIIPHLFLESSTLG